MTRSDVICILSVCSGIFLMIGLPTYLMGCNDSLYPAGCVGYKVDTGIVQSTSIDARTCQTCYSDGNGGQWCSYYECYGFTVYYDVCTEVHETYDKQSDAEVAARSYIHGLKETVFRQKADLNSCTNNSQQVTVNLPITGVTFLVLSGAALVSILIIIIIFIP
jgi:hypothetical protein